VQPILHLHDFLTDLPVAIREEIYAATHFRQVAAEEFVYQQGHSPDFMAQVIDGEVKLCIYSAEGREIITASFRNGDCFGELGLIDGLPRMTSAVAVVPTKLRVLRASSFQFFYQKYPELSRAINLFMSRHVRLLYEFSEEAKSLNLRQKLGRMLCRLGHSHGSATDEGGVMLATSHEELSKLLGASRQSVSKELKALEREGVIAIRYNKLLIHSLAALEEEFSALVSSAAFVASYQDPS
jgi:CRP-like cAMP-binding protein